MIKKNKGKAILSSLLTLLPILLGLALWNDLPENMVSHWGGDGVADGSAPKAFIVFGLPLILLALHWLCLLVTSVEQKGKTQNPKIIATLFWIMPLLSIVISGIIYGVALDVAFPFERLISPVVGLSFVFIGNYLPKTTRNRTYGIKLPWTLGNDENWQKTHRMAGKIWVIVGILLVFSVLLPVVTALVVVIAAVLPAAIIPTVYSYSLYKKHQKEGIVYETAPKSKGEKTVMRIGMVLVPIILILIAVLLFAGDISLEYGEESFTVKAFTMSDLTISYDEVESVTYREQYSAGSRVMGFGSPRLSLGTFKNEEFGRYTLYAYTGVKNCVVLTRGDKVLVITGKTEADTKAIYEALVAKIPS